MLNLSELEKRWPQIHWREPVALRIEGQLVTLYGCRVCLATEGLRASEWGMAVERGILFTDQAQAREHIKEVHAGPDASTGAGR